MTGDFETLGQGVFTNIMFQRWQSSDVTVYVNGPHVQVRSFWNRFSTTFSRTAAYQGQTAYGSSLADVNVVDTEGQYLSTFETGRGVAHDLHLGVSYRYKGVDFSFQDGFRQENHGAVFLHDEVKLGRRFAVVADLRGDYVPFLDRVIPSLRGAALYHPTPKSTVRATFATAFRKPTFLESYVDVPIQLPLNGAYTAGQSLRFDDPTYRVQEEKILSAELGYLTQDSDAFVFDTALYYNQIRDIIQIAPNRPLTLSNVAAGQGPLNVGFAPRAALV
jgi:iron complex outermembrane receptor protein